LVAIKYLWANNGVRKGKIGKRENNLFKSKKDKQLLYSALFASFLFTQRFIVVINLYEI